MPIFLFDRLTVTFTDKCNPHCFVYSIGLFSGPACSTDFWGQQDILSISSFLIMIFTTLCRKIKTLSVQKQSQSSLPIRMVSGNFFLLYIYIVYILIQHAATTKNGIISRIVEILVIVSKILTIFSSHFFN